MITTHTQFVDEAWEYIKFGMLTIDGSVRRYKDISQFPAFLPAMESSDISFSDPWYGGQDLTEVFKFVARASTRAVSASVQARTARHLGIKDSPGRSRREDRRGRGADAGGGRGPRHYCQRRITHSSPPAGRLRILAVARWRGFVRSRPCFGHPARDLTN